MGQFLVQGGVTSSGTADSFLKESHVSRTRHAHQVTAAAVCAPMDKAYKAYRKGGVTGARKQSKKIHNSIIGDLRFTSSSPF